MTTVAKPDVVVKPLCVEELTEEQFQARIESSLERQKSESRQEYMKQKKAELERQLEHYTKIKDRWAKADVGIKITGTVTVVLTSVLASVFSAGITLTASPIIAAVLSGIAAVKTALVETVMISLTTKRKKFYRKKCEIIKEYMNKFYLLYEKSREDNIITLEEITKFHELMNMFNNEMLSLKLNSTYSTLKEPAGVNSVNVEPKAITLHKVDPKPAKQIKQKPVQRIHATQLRHETQTQTDD